MGTHACQLFSNPSLCAVFCWVIPKKTYNTIPEKRKISRKVPPRRELTFAIVSSCSSVRIFSCPLIVKSWVSIVESSINGTAS